MNSIAMMTDGVVGTSRRVNGSGTWFWWKRSLNERSGGVVGLGSGRLRCREFDPIVKQLSESSCRVWLWMDEVSA